MILKNSNSHKIDCYEREKALRKGYIKYNDIIIIRFKVWQNLKFL